MQQLIAVIHQLPIGIIIAGADGKITQMNAKSLQMLLPQFFANGLQGDNINSLLAVIAPSILQQVQNFAPLAGNIVSQLRQPINITGADGNTTTSYYVFTVTRLDEQSIMYSFDDVTELYNKDKQLNQVIQDKAIEQNKFEMASSVLHDIGNAVVGFGSYLTKIKRTVEQTDIAVIENLKGFFVKNEAALQVAIGPAKTQALYTLLNGIMAGQKNNLAEVKQTLAEQMAIISHIQEILSIQRQYVKGQHTEREQVNIRSVLNDAIAMLSGTFEKKGIALVVDIPAAIPLIKGDRTKLVQVFLNLLKNAVDACNTSAETAKKINIAVVANQHNIVVTLQDNGSGFNQETGRHLFTKGYTTKGEGTGLGLANCKTILEAHNGTITITSNGAGKGALSTVNFNLQHN